MTGQHEPLWKPVVKSGAPGGKAFPAPHAAPIMMSPMPYQGMKRTLDKNEITKLPIIYNVTSIFRVTAWTGLTSFISNL